MGIKTIYKIIKEQYRDNRGKLHRKVTYTDDLNMIEKHIDEITGYEMASLDGLNRCEVNSGTFGVHTLKVKEGVVTYNKYFYNTLENEYYFKEDLDEERIDILEEDEDCLEIGIWELV